MNKTKLNNFINRILIVFLIIQPIFDLKIFYNSISTLIRVIIIFALFGYYFFRSKNKKKYLLLLYPVLLGIYFVIHHLNALNFNSLVPGNFDYSIIQEILYFVKMLSPILLIYCLYKSDITINKVLDIMKYLVLIIGIVIVISNLFGFSYGSYSDLQIKANFFEWFNPNSEYVYQELASKGLFEYGNQISAILIMFLPFVLYTTIEKRSVSNWIILVLNVFALILLCTKVSVLGVFIALLYTLFAFVFVLFINKQPIQLKKFAPIGIILIIFCLLLPFNPMLSRMQERATIAEYSKEEEDNTSNITTEIIDDTSNSTSNIISQDSIQHNTEPIEQQILPSESDMMIEYIENNYKSKQLHKQFLFDYYPYRYDPEFWYNFLQNDMSLTTNYRFIELSIIQRVVEINDNKFDMWFGITNTRLQNIFNIEKDFVVQYYALGIIGTILVFAPYFVLLGLFAYRSIKNRLKNLNVINLLSFITIVFLFGISYITGNMINSLSFTIYFAMCFYLIITK